MNDKQRIKFLSELVKNCPTASFHFNDDPDIEFPDGKTMPVGYTIRVEGVCDPILVTESSFRKVVDKLQRTMKQDAKFESISDAPQGPFASFP